MPAGRGLTTGALEATCPVCGTAMTAGEGTIPDEVAGLPVTLVGLTVYRCTRCGQVEPVVEEWMSLLCAIAGALIHKRIRLAPEEIRFLRRALALSKSDLADGLDTTPQTVARWEHGDEPISPPADRRLRLMVVADATTGHSRLGGVIRGDLSLDRLMEIDDAAPPARVPLRLARDARGWRLSWAAC
ncbi:MAG TPA: helix-turn-helix domain-containing protein [Thermodesulfobacteriota bacterium]